MTEKAGNGEALPLPMTSHDVARSMPPPSYEEVMGAYQTSVKREIPDHPPLAYIDIMPRCTFIGNMAGKVAPKFTPFSDVMAGANAWLRDNRGLAVWKCETVERKLERVQDGSLKYDLDTMIRHDSTYGFQVYVRGIRMWLTRNSDPSAPCQQLGLRNVLPDKVDLIIPSRYNRGVLVVTGEGLAVGTMPNMYHHTLQSFEGLTKTIKKMNERLKENPLPGTILNVEAATIKAKEGFFKNDLDPDAASWQDDKSKSKRFTQVIRIYYILGPPANEEIGLEDFVPELMDKGDLLKKPKFDTMSNTVGRMAQSLAVQKGNRIVNIQQFDARVHKSYDGVSVGSDSTDEFSSTFGEEHSIKTFRVFTVKTPGLPPPPPPGCVTTRLFMPVQLGGRACESMGQTMERIEAWLKVTGLPIFGVETVEFLHSTSGNVLQYQEQADYTTRHGSKHWITGIRLYFSNVYSEPDPSLLPPLPKASKSGSSSCTIV